jgi:transcriptional regulator with XRE-family HTH domain
MPITGLDLRAERRAANITVTDLAARMGRSRQTLHVLERSAIITVDQATSYRAALRDAIVASEGKVA